MGVFRNRGLPTKINLVIAVILLFSLALISFVNYRHQRRFVIDEAVQNAESGSLPDDAKVIEDRRTLD